MNVTSRIAPGLTALLPWLLPPLLFVGCRTPRPESTEYMLAREATVADVAGESAAAKLPPLRVRPLIPRSFLDRTEIAWRAGDVNAGAYVYRHWSEPPAEAATRALIGVLRARGRFEQVDGSTSRPIGPLTLSGELLGLHETTERDGSRPAGVAEVELVLERDPAEGAAVRTILHARRSVAAADDSMEALIRAVSEALAQVLDELAPQVEAAAAGS